MKDYQKYINALRKCAKEHENDRTFTGHVIVSDLCRDTANLLEEVEKEEKWIPVSERLPENYDDVLVWCEWWEEDDVLCVSWSIGYYSYREWKLNTPKRGVNVMAWMPLPVPFEPQIDKEK